MADKSKPETNFEEARRRIHQCKETGADTLLLQGLELIELPGEIAELGWLRELNLALTKVGDGVARTLANLTVLTSLNLVGNDIGDDCARAIANNLTAPTSLDLGFNKIGDDGARAIANLTTLTSLNLRGNQIGDPSPLRDLRHLEKLDLDLNPITRADPDLWFLPRLETVVLTRADIPGLPPEVLSQHITDNCLPRLRAHYRDFYAGRAERVSDVKLLLLGNGRVGKTQIARRLRGESFDQNAESTHGAVVTAAELSAPDGGGEPTRLQLWDFGGQDIYLGTHALFLQSRAVVLVCWTPAMEDAAEHDYGGHTFRNFPLDYWLHYVASTAGTDTAVVVVETRCDDPKDGRGVPPADPKNIANFAVVKAGLHHSAKTDRGAASLREALHEAVQWLHDTHGVPEIGAGRAYVKRELEAMREAAQTAPASADATRWITRDQFSAICKRAREEAGEISDEDALLDFLHRTGTVFWRPGVFHGHIVVDQAWALEAIYAVFHRDSGVLRRVRDRQRGRFTLSDLAESLWDHQGYDREAQKLFLAMMASAGICFPLIPALGGGEAEYLAPDLLPPPEHVTLELAQKWDEDAPTHAAHFAFDFLPPGLLRSLMADFGREAGLAGDYWRDGFYLYDTRTDARAIVEQTDADDPERPWGGAIRIRTQKGDAAALLERLSWAVRRAYRAQGLTPPANRRDDGDASEWRAIHGRDEERAEQQTVQPGYEPPEQREHFASYAHGDDDTEDGIWRKAAVERLFAEGKEHGINIRTDVDELRMGDSIVRFMDELARGVVRDARIFVILSDKYLKSTWCMYELYRLWQNSRHDPDTFFRHVDVICLPDADIGDPAARIHHARYWRDEFQRQKDAVGADWDLLSSRDHAKVKAMRDYAQDVGDILSFVAETLHVRRIADIDQLRFDP